MFFLIDQGPQLCQWDNHVESLSYPCYVRLDAAGCGYGIQSRFVMVILKDLLKALTTIQ